MDAVITYVNGLDPLWQEDYRNAIGGKTLTKRYRDWGTLKYLLRGIERHMPFIENVFLLVSRESQVPEWARRENLKVVLHSEIIPGQFLPTFNSTTIEMFMHLIPGLGEEFLYFNDDMFPVMDCRAEDFFRDGKSAIGFTRHLFTNNGYKKRVRNSDRQARKVLGEKTFLPFFFRPQHTCSPMLKSQSDLIYEASKEKIFEVVSPLRTGHNFNQYLYLDYLYFKGLTVRNRISNKHLSPAVYRPEQICSYIDKPSCKMININDVRMSDEAFREYQSKVLASFESHFPEKSRFEL